MKIVIVFPCGKVRRRRPEETSDPDLPLRPSSSTFGTSDPSQEVFSLMFLPRRSKPPVFEMTTPRVSASGISPKKNEIKLSTSQCMDNNYSKNMALFLLQDKKTITEEDLYHGTIPNWCDELQIGTLTLRKVPRKVSIAIRDFLWKKTTENAYKLHPCIVAEILVSCKEGDTKNALKYFNSFRDPIRECRLDIFWYLHFLCQCLYDAAYKGVVSDIKKMKKNFWNEYNVLKYCYPNKVKKKYFDPEEIILKGLVAGFQDYKDNEKTFWRHLAIYNHNLFRDLRDLRERAKYYLVSIQKAAETSTNILFFRRLAEEMYRLKNEGQIDFDDKDIYLHVKEEVCCKILVLCEIVEKYYGTIDWEIGEAFITESDDNSSCFAFLLHRGFYVLPKDPQTIETMALNAVNHDNYKIAMAILGAHDSFDENDGIEILTKYCSMIATKVDIYTPLWHFFQVKSYSQRLAKETLEALEALEDDDRYKEIKHALMYLDGY